MIYLEYFSIDYDNGVGMNPEEEDYLEYRDFLWIEKESFEGYMGVKVHEAMTYSRKNAHLIERLRGGYLYAQSTV